MNVKDFTKDIKRKYDNHCAYLWGGSGQVVSKTTLGTIINMEDSKAHAVKVVKHVADMIDKGYNLDKAQFFDCSGNIVDSLNKFGIYKGDLRANDLFIMGTSISLKNAKEGDLVFNGEPTHKNHVGYVAEDGNVYECKGRDYGMYISKVEDWQYAARYTWFDDFKLTRKLKLTKPTMTGADVMNLQKALGSHGFPCAVTGTFTENTKDAVTKFQKANKLAVLSYGTVARKTAEALGFVYK